MAPPEPHESLLLRLAVAEDRDRLGEIYVASRAAAYPAMPASTHPPAEASSYWASALDRCSAVWVAEQDAGVVGFAAVTGDWLDGLYVHPDAQGQGVGGALLEVVKASCPGGFSLWVFQTNVAARRLYERHGLLELEHTDGADNQERSPDLRMAWPGRDPVGFLRGQVDAVDDELAGLLARRAALTAAIQPLKPVAGQAGRDSDREAEIAARMAARAPALGEQRIRRIMHEVITTSLDAAGG